MLNKMDLEKILQKAREMGNPHIAGLCEAVREFMDLMDARSQPRANGALFLQELRSSYRCAWESLYKAADALGVDVESLEAGPKMSLEQVSSAYQEGLNQSLGSIEKPANLRLKKRNKRNKKQQVRV